MLNIAVCDDDLDSRSVFVDSLKHIINKNNINAQILFDTGDISSFIEFIKTGVVNVVFLDIKFKNSSKTGFYIAKKIREIDSGINIVFTTAYFEYVLTSYKYVTFDYLIKPISYQVLEDCILRLNKYINFNVKNSMVLKTSDGICFVNKNDIFYIEKIKNKCKLFTKVGTFETRINLDKIFSNLDQNFVRCHRSFIVNLKNLKKIDNYQNMVYFDNNEFCFIGRKYKKCFMESVYKDYGNF